MLLRHSRGIRTTSSINAQGNDSVVRAGRDYDRLDGQTVTIPVVSSSHSRPRAHQ